ncbi:MAG TPA: cellulase family glycosylhydrolase [Solirubrobacteraceae bacterium]|nr:cellulase family glycosylhydrolase [Solirubrobacteraceae bacterium]
MTRIHLHGRARAWLLSPIAALVAVAAAFALHATPAAASTKQVSLIQDGVALNENPTADLAEMKELGGNTVRVLLFWWQVAPNSSSRTAPKGFTASNPAAYPARNWAQWDAIVEAAKAEGIRVDLDITGAPPDWADGKGVPKKFTNDRFGWIPNATDYGQFVTAVATRYSGHYTPPGASAPLPKVSLYSLWNEPNFGQNLGPQYVGATNKTAGLPVAPMYYRNLLRTGWTALRQHAKGATILIGELAGTGKGILPKRHNLPYGLPGQVSISFPAPFIQQLYCVSSLSAAVAKSVGCPTGKARGSFVRKNPALFDASAFSMHPYASHWTPTAKASTIPKNDIVFPVIGRLSTLLGQVTNAWHHHRTYNIWSTEFGYVTSPPQTSTKSKPYPSPQQAAIYLNEAEYLSYRNPRIASYAQYLLKDPQRLTGVGLFASGLISANGAPKPAFNAYRMPVWMPQQTVKKGQNTLIWGGARPAPAGYQATHTAQPVQIQQLFGGVWHTLATVNASTSTGYFETHVRFNNSGSLRLAYTYPATELALPAGVAGTTIYSRTVPVTAH